MKSYKDFVAITELNKQSSTKKTAGTSIHFVKRETYMLP
jgi:hypothetical protein